MRYISKHEADVYLDKERRKNTEQKKKKKTEDGGKEAFTLQLRTSLVAAAVETESPTSYTTSPVYLFHFSLFLIEKIQRRRLSPQTGTKRGNRR